jgi:hypothetical protein
MNKESKFKEEDLNNHYTIGIPELIKRPIIRNDYNEEWMNKMTNEELSQLDKEIYSIIESEGITGYPEINSSHLSKFIDRNILYNITKLGKL